MGMEGVEKACWEAVRACLSRPKREKKDNKWRGDAGKTPHPPRGDRVLPPSL